MADPDFTLEVLKLETGAGLEGKAFDRCALILSTHHSIIGCTFTDCIFLNEDGSSFRFGGIVAGGEYADLGGRLPPEAADLLGPQIRALGAIRYRADLDARATNGEQPTA